MKDCVNVFAEVSRQSANDFIFVLLTRNIQLLDVIESTYYGNTPVVITNYKVQVIASIRRIGHSLFTLQTFRVCTKNNFCYCK
jgi:hypothetical protein